MIVEKKNFPSKIPDNESNYFSAVIGIVGSIDTDATILITKKISAISFRIDPSSTSLLNHLIKGINEVNNTFGIRVNFSKSIKTLYNINFDIPIE